MAARDARGRGRRPLQWLGLLAIYSALVSLALVQQVARGAEQVRDLQVRQDTSGISVEADEATLPEVLQALGAQVGFTLVDFGGPRPRIARVEVRQPTLGEALQRLLAGHSYAIRYRPEIEGVERETVDRIFLLRPRQTDEGSSPRQPPTDLPESLERPLDRGLETARALLRAWRSAAEADAPSTVETPAKPVALALDDYQWSSAQMREQLRAWRISVERERGVIPHLPSPEEQASVQRIRRAEERARSRLNEWLETR